jgi:hypothetical protein
VNRDRQSWWAFDGTGVAAVAPVAVERGPAAPGLALVALALVRYGTAGARQDYHRRSHRGDYLVVGSVESRRSGYLSYAQSSSMVHAYFVIEGAVEPMRT